jgi:hypothetical protein
MMKSTLHSFAIFCVLAIGECWSAEEAGRESPARIRNKETGTLCAHGVSAMKCALGRRHVRGRVRWAAGRGAGRHRCRRHGLDRGVAFQATGGRKACAVTGSAVRQQ